MAEAERPMGMPAINPITVEIIKGGLQALLREVDVLIERTAVSAFIREKRDHFCGVFDGRGQVIMCDVERHGRRGRGPRCCPPAR